MATCRIGLGPANAIRAQPVLAPTPTPGTSTPRSNAPDTTSALSPATLRRINAPYSRTATTLVFIPVRPVLCRITILPPSRVLSLPILRGDTNAPVTGIMHFDTTSVVAVVCPLNILAAKCIKSLFYAQQKYG